jgi:hypothetical protein
MSTGPSKRSKPSPVDPFFPCPRAATSNPVLTHYTPTTVRAIADGDHPPQSFKGQCRYKVKSGSMLRSRTMKPKARQTRCWLIAADHLAATVRAACRWDADAGTFQRWRTLQRKGGPSGSCGACRRARGPRDRAYQAYRVPEKPWWQCLAWVYARENREGWRR